MTQDFNFISLDFEASNPNYTSACQIGMVKFKNGVEIDTYKTLINPQEYFTDATIEVHGIKPHDVIGQPKWNEVYQPICDFIGEYPVASFGFYDKKVWAACVEKYNLPQSQFTWLNAALPCLEAWPRTGKSKYRSYGLGKLSRRFDIKFKHHDALEDARVAGLLLMKASEEVAKDMDYWIKEFAHLNSYQEYREQVKMQKE